MKKLILTLVSVFALSITLLSQYKYNETSTERFIYSIREYRVINGVEDSVTKMIKTTKLDSTWTTFFQDSIQVSDAIELPVLYDVEAKNMNRVVSEAYANEMFNHLIEKNIQFKDFCLLSNLPRCIVICKTRYTSSDSYYVFTILTKK